jgi:hypothetical protein
MAKLDTVKARASFDSLSKFVNQQAVVDALDRAGKDRAILRKAKQDAKAFLKDEGLTLPPRTEFTVSEARIAVGQIRVCLTVCQVSGGRLFCVRICSTIIVIVVS